MRQLLLLRLDLNVNHDIHSILRYQFFDVNMLIAGRMFFEYNYFTKHKNTITKRFCPSTDKRIFLMSSEIERMGGYNNMKNIEIYCEAIKDNS